MKTADDACDQAMKEVVARLAVLPPLDYDRVRVGEADHLGVRLATLDDEVARWRQARNREPAEGQRSRWPVPTLWPEPVHGAGLLTEIADFVSTYVHLPTPAASTVALWIVMTWLHDRLDLSPFLHLTSATRRCGKSALLELIGTLVRRPLMTGHATVAVMFRHPERQRRPSGSHCNLEEVRQWQDHRPARRRANAKHPADSERQNRATAGTSAESASPGTTAWRVRPSPDRPHARG